MKRLSVQTPETVLLWVLARYPTSSATPPGRTGR